jgi:hypothetical protein
MGATYAQIVFASVLAVIVLVRDQASLLIVYVEPASLAKACAEDCTR